jgi:hypothetical protein
VIKRGLVVTAWTVVGHSVLGALYWLLLQIPESNVVMLTASLLVVVLGIATAGIVEVAALAGLRPDARPAAAVALGLRRAAWVIVPLALFAAVWWLTGFAGAWLNAVRGEIDAWFIAKLGWTDVSWFHTSAAWAVWFVRYPFAVAVSVSLLASLADAGLGGLRGAGWLTRACHWRTVLVVTFALLVGFYLLWRFVVPWQPAGLPVSWIQPAFAGLKLLLVFLGMNAAWAIVLACAGRPFGVVTPPAPASAVQETAAPNATT